MRAHAQEQKRTMRAYAHDARLLAQKAAHLLNGAFIEYGRPPNHLWISSQADLTLKSELNPNGGLVKDLIMP
jgi:hypothetical protein